MPPEAIPRRRAARTGRCRRQHERRRNVRRRKSRARKRNEQQSDWSFDPRFVQCRDAVAETWRKNAEMCSTDRAVKAKGPRRIPARLPLRCAPVDFTHNVELLTTTLRASPPSPRVQSGAPWLSAHMRCVSGSVKSLVIVTSFLISQTHMGIDCLFGNFGYSPPTGTASKCKSQLSAVIGFRSP